MTYIADTGDAPNTFGSPSHIPRFSWTGGEIKTGMAGGVETNTVVDIFSSTFQMATPVQPDIRLGQRVDVETTDVRGVSARGDDSHGTDGVSDEDALSSPVVTNLLVGGQTYTLKDIACTATPVAAPVYGYIDFNLNGRYDLATERSAMAMCSGNNSKVNLSWTVPNDVSGGPSYLRLRIAANANEISTADSLSYSGEVEDHPITLTTARITLVKDLDGRIGNTDQFNISVTERGAILTSAVTSGSGSGTHAVISTSFASVTPGQTISLKEVASNAASFANYRRSISCVRGDDDVSNILPQMTYTAGSDNDVWTYTPVAGQDLVCTITNIGLPAVAIAKTTVGGFGEPVTINGTNLVAPLPVLTTTASNSAVTSTGRGVNVTDMGASVVLSEMAVPGYALTSAQCIDRVAAQTGNPATFGALSGTDLTIAPENLKPGAQILCSFTNSKYAKLKLSKSLPKGRYFSDDQFTLQVTTGGSIIGSVTTTGVDATVNETIALEDLVPGTTLNLTETTASATADFARYLTSWNCTNASPLSGGQMTVGTGIAIPVTLAAGDDLRCVLINQRNTKADLSISKTNTPNVGPSDQSNDVLYPGDTTTYVVTIRNDGPDAYTGAVVRDAAPAAPLVCPAAQPVTCSGPGCPNGPLTLGQLQSPGGLIMNTIPNGGTLTLSYSCTVQ